MGVSSALSGAVGFVPAGVVVPFAGSSAPANWLLCDGSAVSRTTYGQLFAAISTTYGSGDGSTTFNLPDMRGRVPAGKDNMGGSAASRLTSGVSGITGTTLGATGGNENVHQHSHANTASFSGSFSGTAGTTGNDSPDHSHAYTRAYSDGFQYAQGDKYSVRNAQDSPQTGGASTRHQHSFTPAGTISGTVTMSNANFGSGASQNVQPTIILNYIIKV